MQHWLQGDALFLTHSDRSPEYCHTASVGVTPLAI